jgi:hypothetical protein
MIKPKEYIVKKFMFTLLMLASSLNAFAAWPQDKIDIKESFEFDIAENSSHSKTVTSTRISYVYGADGYQWHVALFGNSYIGTSLGGPNLGKQEVYENGILISYSWSFTDHKNHTTWHYSDCDVHTYKDKVIVIKH